MNIVLLMFGLRRDEDPAYFHNNKLPKAAFLYGCFFKNMLKAYGQFKKARSSYRFDAGIMGVVEGKKGPYKKWGEDVDVIYGVLLSPHYDYFYGIGVDLTKRTITIFTCDGDLDKDRDLLERCLKPFADMFAALHPDPAKKSIPFSIMMFSEKDTPKTKSEATRGLFVLKMVECHSMGIHDMTKLTDENVEDIRTKLAADVYHQFVD